MKNIIIYRKDGAIRVMKVAEKSNFNNLGKDIEGKNFYKQETL